MNHTYHICSKGTQIRQGDLVGDQFINTFVSIFLKSMWHCQRKTIFQWKHWECLSCSYPPLFMFFPLVASLHLGGLPDSATHTPYPLYWLSRSASVLLGQMTHTIIARFVKSVCWLDLTRRAQWRERVGAEWPAWWRSWQSAGAAGFRTRKQGRGYFAKRFRS